MLSSKNCNISRTVYGERIKLNNPRLVFIEVSKCLFAAFFLLLCWFFFSSALCLSANVKLL